MTRKEFACLLIGVVITLGFVTLPISYRAKNEVLSLTSQANTLMDYAAMLENAPPDTIFVEKPITVTAIVTAYSPDEKSCGPWADGYTATMTDASKPGVAVDPSRIPYGSLVVIGDNIYVADDTGSAMKKSEDIHIDLRLPTHEQALMFGRQELEVQIYPKGICE